MRPSMRKENLYNASKDLLKDILFGFDTPLRNIQIQNVEKISKMNRFKF